MELKIQNQQTLTDRASAEMAKMQAELTQLRETTMQYSLSLDNALQGIERRLGRLEQQGAATTLSAAQPPAGLEPTVSERLSDLENRAARSGESLNSSRTVQELGPRV
ncbi:MAG: hypothetical protein ACLQVD_10800 [Capsulimonadaceae bacterium]